MPFSPQTKKPGDLIRSADWNDAMAEVVRLESQKVNRAGDTFEGNVRINGNVGLGAPAGTERLIVQGAVKATSFAGGGALLTGLNGSQITSGTIPEAQIPATIARTANIPAYDLRKSGSASVQYYEANANGAGQTISFGCRPVALWVVGSVKAILKGAWVGGSFFGLADLRTGACHCTGVSITRTDSSPYPDCQPILGAGLCLAQFSYLTTEETLSVSAQSVTNTGLTLVLHRQVGSGTGTSTSTSTTKAPKKVALSSFRLEMRILCYGA